jgi:hypothetical protein
MSRFGQLEVISTNIGIASTGLPPEGRASENPDLLSDGTFVTFILPEHRDTYFEFVRLVMGGLVLESAMDTPLPDGTIMQSSIFGITAFSGSYRGETTYCFLPNVHQDFLPMLGDDPAAALDGYHQRIINETNAALGHGSPYRLESLELS